MIFIYITYLLPLLPYASWLHSGRIKAHEYDQGGMLVGIIRDRKNQWVKKIFAYCIIICKCNTKDKNTVFPCKFFFPSIITGYCLSCLQKNWVSMGVISDGSYGIREGLMYSYPVKIQDKAWTIVQDLKISQFAREKMDATAAELSEELDAALAECEA